MRSLVHRSGRTAPERPKPIGPLAGGFLMGLLALGVAGSAFWMASTVIHSNAQAAAILMSFEP